MSGTAIGCHGSVTDTAQRSRAVSITGTRADSVVNVLKERLRGGPGMDRHRLGLVVEGGGMRGVHTAAALLALHALGASGAFDDVFATSAGAINAAYFLSGRGEASADGYHRVLADGRFINPRRPWKLVDVDFVADEMLVRLRPLDVAGVLASRSRFWIAVADFDAASARLLQVTRDGDPLLDLLKASIALPVYYNELVRLRDLRAFDAGLCNPLPVADAIRAGCSHVLVLASRPDHHVDVPTPRWKRALFDWRFARGKPGLNAMLANAWRVTNELRAQATGRSPTGGDDFEAIAALSPTLATITETTQNRMLLGRTLLEGARAVLDLLDADREARARLEGWIGTGVV